VAIGKIEDAGAVVIAPRHVVPLIRVVHGGVQPAIIDRVGIFVRKNSEL
jgi:hypothetical protein